MARQRRTVEGSTLPKDGLKDVPLTALVHNPRNPRDDYDDVEELAAGIKAVGLLTPLSVTRYELFLTHFPEYEAEIAGHDWVVLNGNRRLAALHQLKWAKVPVIVADHLGRDGMFDEAVLADNIHNKRLPVMREALALKQLVDRHGSQAVVAERLGKSRAYVSQRIGLLRLTDDLQTEVRTGSLQFEDARTLSALPKEQQPSQRQRLRELGGIADDVDTARRMFADEKREQRAPKAADADQPAPRGRPRGKTLRIGTPEELAAALRDVLSPSDLATLAQLLTQPTS
ncbi:ParB/RepB/Spo0J family partition protein [Amycolatopsis sp. PS_44_ISF1]|uniref:ParB/RepB/Spo0J family partition protein n=1 Tax=Amycolatopsis sp. PS_44_ISF1 TaxID=2974917 RepID=UPI0028DE10DE|nr:ParB/RepB/Spo0J family partition protein [Amycolatopsis sp. PS_44_ISF1]MDT8916220.1 ParB/RepB/Spo0J family partition protein [Amycolatopsis sp. PS_44_ISF1]